MSDDEILLPSLDDDRFDAVLSACRSLSPLIPILGPISELLAVTGPEINRRQNEWIYGLYNGLVELSEMVAKLDRSALKDDPEFLTVVIRATRIAIASHQNEKIKALRNAVLNSTVTDLSIDIVLSFIDLVDFLTPSHMKLLSFLNNPKEFMTVHGIEIGQGQFQLSIVIERAIPGISDDVDFYELMVKDLISRGLVSDSATIMRSVAAARNLDRCYLTNIGSRFIDFISDPHCAEQ